MCIFVFMIFNPNYIKFKIDINNDELLKTIWEHKQKEKKLIIIGNAKEYEAQVSL